jgi:hypothetical protein
MSSTGCNGNADELRGFSLWRRAMSLLMAPLKESFVS